mmetsp:Transcript_76595/g.206388  ORF Transcript_76595/g.206388 Transcript_76595/m.206388 type:complete len:199 (-) Transcript_76595:206-802(-)
MEYGIGSYEGTWMDGRKHGHGIWIINEEKRYVGEFDSGDIHGQGARCFCVCFCLCSLCVPGTLYVHHCCFQGLWHDWTIQKGLAHQLGRGWFEFEFLQGPQDIKYLRSIFDPRPEILRRVQTDDERAAMERLLRQVLEAQDARAVAEKLRTGPCGVINQEELDQLFRYFPVRLPEAMRLTAAEDESVRGLMEILQGQE